MSSLPLSLIEAYNTTNYSVLEAKMFVLNIGKKSDGLEDLYRRWDVNSSAFITAFNPFSKALTLEENIIRNEALKNELYGIAMAVVNGYGQDQDGHWEKEDSFLAFGITKDEALRLGKKYEQNAILWCDADFTPQLILLR